MRAHIPNAVGHFDVAGPDAAALHRFYEGVFNWRMDHKGPGYSLIGTPEGSVRGAVIEAETPALTIGIVVPSLDKAIDAALALGGEVIMPATDNGWVRKAMIGDPAGNRMTLIEA